MLRSPSFNSNEIQIYPGMWVRTTKRVAWVIDGSWIWIEAGEPGLIKPAAFGDAGLTILFEKVKNPESGGIFKMMLTKPGSVMPGWLELVENGKR